MKTNSIMAILLLATLSGQSFAQKNPNLPDVPAPRELTEVGSEYAEGTITRMSDQDVSVFVPWAQNAQSVLTKALKDVETMTVQQQVRHLTAIIKSVVKNSGQKNYQLFMRFALNRTLLLVQELTLQSDWNTPGTVENVLDIQIKGINLALQFYESDLAYQRRANRGNDSVNLSYALFGSAFGRTMLASIQNITDASAQYRLLYKTLEMINWDFSRDSIAIEFSDTIVEIYNTLNTLNEQPTNNDFESVLAIRRLNVLLAPISTVERTILMSSEATRRELEEQERLARMGAAQRQIEMALSTGITVLAEDILFVISGSNTQERYASCLQQYPAGSVDEILITFKDRSFKQLFNSANYWDKTFGCQLILNSLDAVPALNEKMFNIYGSFEQTGFNFQGSSFASLLNQCILFYPNVKGSVDDIWVGVNELKPQALHNSADYWGRPRDLCIVTLNKAMEMAR